MAKLYFRHGAMGSSKTANALMVRFNYVERGQKAVLLKPKIENRDGETIIKSRIGLESKCEFAEDYLTKEHLELLYAGIDLPNAIIVDEAQFLKEEEIGTLANIVDDLNIPVICYGLRTDFQGHLFEGSKKLMEIANVIEEIPTICWCGRKALFNARFQDEKIVRDGEQVVLGGNESYIALCRKHFRDGKIHA